MDEEFQRAVTTTGAAERVAAIAAWLQSLVDDEKPVLVGGAAVELYTGGAYHTGDLDFVGELSSEAESNLEAVGFDRRGRHWLHEEQEIFLEFPSTQLEDGDTTAIIQAGEYSVLVIGLEELIVDRLAAWHFWGSSIDAANAYLLHQDSGAQPDEARLDQLAESKEVAAALCALEDFVRSLDGRRPTDEETREWASQRFGRQR